MKRKHDYLNGESELLIRQRYLSLVKGWAQEQREGVRYWMSSDEKRSVNYSEKKRQQRLLEKK